MAILVSVDSTGCEPAALKAIGSHSTASCRRMLRRPGVPIASSQLLCAQDRTPLGNARQGSRQRGSLYRCSLLGPRSTGGLRDSGRCNELAPSLSPPLACTIFAMGGRDSRDALRDQCLQPKLARGIWSRGLCIVRCSLCHRATSRHLCHGQDDGLDTHSFQAIGDHRILAKRRDCASCQRARSSKQHTQPLPPIPTPDAPFRS